MHARLRGRYPNRVSDELRGKNMKTAFQSALLAFAISAASSAQAATVFESFPNYATAGDTPVIFCSSCGGAGAVFASFTLTANQVLDKAFVLVAAPSSNPGQASNTMTVSLFADGGDDLPVRDSTGAVLLPFLSTGYTAPTFVTPGGPRTDGYANFVAEFALPNWSLSSGKYWVRFAGYANLLPAYTTATPSNSRIVGTDFFLEGRNLTLNSRDRTIGFSFNGVSVGNPGAVPESATWAMMLLGFGTIGVTLRRRSSVKTRASIV